MLIQPLIDKLIQLRLPAFRDGLQEQLNNPKYAQLTFEERLALLVDLEVTRRHDRRIQRLIKLADFPQPASIEDLDMSASRGLECRFVLELTQGNWIDQHLNTLVLGPTGSGKSYLSCSLGLAACRTGHSVRYFRTSRLLFQIAQTHQDGSYPVLLARLAKVDLLILDDRYGRVSTLVASQLPVSDWFTQFPSPTHADAILDRIIHNAHRLNLIGDSQRRLRSPIAMPST